MTPNEHANQALNNLESGWHAMKPAEMVDWLTSMIAAAVEEERKACAEIADGEEQRQMEEARMPHKTPEARQSSDNAAWSCRKIAGIIRAQSDS